jgi:hypothetical protein
MLPSMTGASQAQVSLCSAIAASARAGSKSRRIAIAPHGHARQVEGADVIERAGDEQLVMGAKAEGEDVVGALPVEVGVGVHDALGAVGGARGVHETEEVVGL